MAFHHVSVLLNECLENFVRDPDGIYVDCTLGGAGHAHAIGERLSAKGHLLGFDQDQTARQVAAERLSDLACQVTIIPSNFKNLKDELSKRQISGVTAFLFDLGVSSYQLDTPERGFSYMHDGPLDMRMDQSNPLTAEEIVNTYSEADITRLIKEYGEERWAKRIAQFICKRREEEPLRRTGQLVELIKQAIPAGARKDGPHPAKRTFQAFRIEVNQELAILAQSFRDAVDFLKPGGRIGVITFQSLEDRIAKQTFKELSTGCICPPELPVCVCGHKALVKARNKAIEPTEAEVKANPRARSARLRIAEKL